MEILRKGLEAGVETTTCECERCHSLLLVKKDDVYTGQFGLPYCKCPVCDFENSLEVDEWCKDITYENIEFPNDFHETHNELCGNEDVFNKVIVKNIKESLKSLAMNKNRTFRFIDSFNGFVFIAKETSNVDDNTAYHIYIAKNYYDLMLDGSQVDEYVK